MQESAIFIQEAYDALGAISYVSMAEAFLEESVEAQDTVTQNDSLMLKAVNGVKKAITAIIEFIKNTLSKFKAGVVKLFSKETKKDYDQAVKNIRSNPELGNTKVEIQDIDVLNAPFDEALKQLDAELKKENPSKEVGEAILAKLQEKLKTVTSEGGRVTSRAMTAVTLKTLCDIADKNVQSAKLINTALEQELINLEDARKILGDKSVARYEKKIAKYAANTALHRLKAKVFHYKEATLMSVLKDEFKMICSYTNIDSEHPLKNKANGKDPVTKGTIIKGAIKNPRFTLDAMGGVKGVRQAAKVAGDVADSIDKITDMKNKGKKAAAKEKKEAEKKAGALKSNLSDLASFIGVTKK